MFFFWPFWYIGSYGIVALIWDLVGIVFFVLFLYIFFRWFRFRPWNFHDKSNEACEILKRRYAAGEITREEYEEMKKDLHCK